MASRRTHGASPRNKPVKKALEKSKEFFEQQVTPGHLATRWNESMMCSKGTACCDRSQHEGAGTVRDMDTLPLCALEEANKRAGLALSLIGAPIRLVARRQINLFTVA
jgi:hypothetical protein